MRMRSLKSIIFQRKSKSQVTAPDDKQVAILKNGLQILMCKVLILATMLLKKLQMTPPMKTTKHVQKSDFIFQETFSCEVCNHKHDRDIFEKAHGIQADDNNFLGGERKPVSYTHLTLPTKA